MSLCVCVREREREKRVGKVRERQGRLRNPHGDVQEAKLWSGGNCRTLKQSPGQGLSKGKQEGGQEVPRCLPGPVSGPPVKPTRLYPHPQPPSPRPTPPTAAPPPAPQKCIDWNRAVLKRELGLTERDIVDIPQLFKLIKDSRGTPKAEAFFPNMVRMRTSEPAQLCPQS